MRTTSGPGSSPSASSGGRGRERPRAVLPDPAGTQLARDRAGLGQAGHPHPDRQAILGPAPAAHRDDSGVRRAAGPPDGRRAQGEPVLSRRRDRRHLGADRGPATFYAVREILTDPARKTTRPGRAVHLLSVSSAAVCGVCSGPLATSNRLTGTDVARAGPIAAPSPAMSALPRPTLTRSPRPR